LSVCPSVRLSVCPKYLSFSIATAVFVRSSSNLKCRWHIWQRRASSKASNTGSSKRACASIYFRFGSLSGLHALEKIALMSNISKTVTDTTIGSMEAEYKNAPGLSFGTMTFDLRWPWTVLVHGHQNCTSNISKNDDRYRQHWTDYEFAWTLSCSIHIVHAPTANVPVDLSLHFWMASALRLQLQQVSYSLGHLSQVRDNATDYNRRTADIDFPHNGWCYGYVDENNIIGSPWIVTHSWIQHAYSRPLFSASDFYPEIGHVDLVLVCDQGSLAGL